MRDYATPTGPALPMVSASALVLPVRPAAWALVLLAALWLRIGAIDAVPLDPSEAEWALEGRAIWRGEAQDYRAQPLLPNLLAVSFALFTDADGPARLPAALAGWALCLTPLLFRERLGWGASLAAALLLAVSPLAVLASRSAQPAVLAALAAAAAVGCLFAAWSRQDGRWLLGIGVATGLGIGSTPAFVGHLVAIALALAIWPPFARVAVPDLRAWLPRAALVGLLVVLLFHTLLMTRPDGMQSGLIDPFPAWLRSVGLGGVALFAGASLGLHEIALLPLAAYGLIVGSDRRLSGFLATWSATGVLMALLGRTLELSAFLAPVVPLALLGGIGAARLGWIAHARRTAVWLTGLAALVPVVALVLAVNIGVQRGGAVSFALLVVAAGGLIGVILVAGAWLDRREMAVALALALGTLLGGLWLTSLTRLNFVGFERGGPALLGQSSRPELYEVEARVRDWWRQDPNGPISVDASLRPVLAWSLRDGPPVEWSNAPPASAQRAILGGLTGANRPPGTWIRLAVVDRYVLPNQWLGFRSLWRWFVQREPIARSDPHAILLAQ